MLAGQIAWVEQTVWVNVLNISSVCKGLNLAFSYTCTLQKLPVYMPHNRPNIVQSKTIIYFLLATRITVTYTKEPAQSIQMKNKKCRCFLR